MQDKFTFRQFFVTPTLFGLWIWLDFPFNVVHVQPDEVFMVKSLDKYPSQFLTVA